MKKRITFALALILATFSITNACTNFIVGKNASVDGSTMVTYAADSYWLYGSLYHYPAASYPEDAMLDIYEWDSGNFLGKIKQVAQTYNVVGNMNEHQLTIAETTWGGREELIDTTGIMDYGSLIYVTLQRAKTAREAIVTIVNLVNEYGYFSSGESFSIVDPNEAWIMELIGKGPGSKSFVWVARRIPDNCISGHANQARITTFPLENRKNKTTISSKNLKKIYNPEVTTVYAHDVISFAREKGYFNGTDAEFSFSDTYNPLDFSGVRACEARVWSFFRRHNKSMDKYLSYITCETKERMPLWILPERKLSVKDLQDAMRDHYEGTPLDMSKGPGAGPFNSVYRMTPLIYKHNGKEYFHERPVATQQTGFSFIAQMRNFVPTEAGGILWFGLDDATCNVYVPIYSCITEIPESMSEQNGSILDFSWTSAFWINNWVASMVYPRYSMLYPEVKKRQSKLEEKFFTDVNEADKHVATLAQDGKTQEIRTFLNQFCQLEAEKAINSWRKLGEYLMVKYLDDAIKGEKGSDFDGNHKRIPNKVTRPGYPSEYIQREFIRTNPNRFRVKTAEEMEKRK
jgi:dipeptidase